MPRPYGLSPSVRLWRSCKRALVAVVQEFGQLLAQHLVAFVAMPKEDGTLE